MEKFKIRCFYGDETFFSEVVGERCFEYKGHSFFVHEDDEVWKVSDCLSGIRVTEGFFRQEVIDKALRMIHTRFDDYLKGLKKRPRANWKKKIPVEVDRKSMIRM